MPRIIAASAAVLVLVLFAVLATRNPMFTLFSPRGGALTLAFSLVLANAAIWAARQPHRELATRFQLAAAGWIWLLLQLGAMIYMLGEMG